MKLNRLLPVSVFAAAGASYLINVFAAIATSSVVEYAQYTQLLAWASYAAAIGGLLIIELKVSPEGQQLPLAGLLTVSSLTALSLWGAALLILYGAGRAHLAPLATLALVMVLFRSLLTSAILRGAQRMAILLRVSRALVLVACGGAVVLLQWKVDAGVFIWIQLCALALPVCSLGIRQIALGRARAARVWRHIVAREWLRLLKRNASYMVDMVHTPMLFTALAALAASARHAAVVYAVALALPVMFVANEIAVDAVRVRFGMTDGAGLRRQLRQRLRLHCLYVGLCLAAAACGLGLALLVQWQRMPLSYATAATLLLFLLCLLPSSFAGLVINRLGLERFDLYNNVFITAVVVAVVTGGLAPGTTVLGVLLSIILKYIMQQLIILVNLYKPE